MQTKRRDVAEEYARARSLEFQPKAWLRCPPSRRRNTWLCRWAIVGPIAGGRPGILYVCNQGPPAAQFAIAGLESVIDGLCVHRSGHNLLTRQPLPKGYKELKQHDGEFSTHFRLGISSPDSLPSAQRLLDPEFTGWLVDHGVQGTSLTQAGTFEIVGGVLFLCGDQLCFSSAEALDTVAHAAAGLADRVAAWVRPSETRLPGEREKGLLDGC